MDAFKLLTRSTKLKSAGATAQAKQIAQSSILPSAGEAVTPQLFMIEKGRKLERESEKNVRKRKRENHVTKDDIELDFFGSLSRKAGHEEKKEKHRKDEEPRENASDSDSDKGCDNVDDVLAEEERRAILNSHKIKITDLRTSAREALEKAAPSKDESSKKKKKKKSNKEKKQVVTPPMTRKQIKKALLMYPPSLTSFAPLRSRYRISPRLARNIADQGYSLPTEVQLAALPLLLGDCPQVDVKTHERSVPPMPDATNEPDVLVVAPTGSGKTLAFMIPLISKVMRKHHENPEERHIFAIVLAPTKELVGQIVNEGRKLAKGLGVKVTAMKKGMRLLESVHDEGKDAKKNSDDSDNSIESDDEFASEDNEDEVEDSDTRVKGIKTASRAPLTKCDIIVSTPLILVNSLTGNKTHPANPLPSVVSLILDEADVLLDPLFREQTLAIWHACTNPDLHVGLWSATIGSNIEELMQATIKERRETLHFPGESDLIRIVVGIKDTAIPNVSHKLIYAATEQGKLLGLRQIIRPSGLIRATNGSQQQEMHLRPPFLIFTQTIARAVALYSELMYDIPAEAGGSSRIAVLHSDLSDTRRSAIMTQFRKGEIWILITTDLLSRGVDFRGINGIVNYDIPTTAASYVHRAGRTGRAGRSGGMAITFYTKEDIPYVKNIANVIAASEKLRDVKQGEGGIQKWLMDALPSLSKKDKKDLKQHGVAIRRPSALKGKTDAKELEKAARRTRISTKSGFERRRENNIRGAIESSKRRKLLEGNEEYESSDSE
ncbi:RNA-dependent ATPase rok1 [Ascosphaera aggregata]|nr:RNA-dependent ATPase rok1 [Ascosphaera aggregata]